MQHMFRTSFFIATFLAICLSGSISAQEVECNVVVREASDGPAPDGSIMLIMVRGNPEFTVYLYDKAPWKGGTQLRKIEHVSTRTFTLDEIPSGEYYVIVEDRDNNPWAQAIAVGLRPN